MKIMTKWLLAAALLTATGWLTGCGVSRDNTPVSEDQLKQEAEAAKAAEAEEEASADGEE